ncbi:hypothetical protein [Arthrobacter sp. ISL-5]|uniref:hypothetical protein n=1 Tax=Arthrobacter sp. ISL-5 TaxID=2819111 RepID=UPI001BE5C8A7|nr:hypothetical protein [Arthrobacter sp. ISL-5]
MGEMVEVWAGGSYAYMAYIDDRSNDGQLLWIIEDGTATRTLFLRDDNITLYPV